MDTVIEFTLDSTGRITIPSDVKSRLQLKPGMTFIVETDEQGNLQLRLQPSEPALINDGGVLVVASQSSDEALTDVVRRQREDRIESLVQQTGL